MRNSRGYIGTLVNISSAELSDIIYILFRSSCNNIHSMKRFYGIFSCCGFSAEHNSTCSVVYRICYIGSFSSCRTRILNHRVKHLCSGYYLLSRLIRLLDKLLLNYGNLLKRNFYTHISSCNHNSVGSPYNFIYILNALFVFYLGNNTHIITII